MSTYFDLVCLDCNAPAGFDHWNWGDTALAQLWAHREKIVALVPLVASDLDLRVEVDSARRYVPVDWFVVHRTHNVRVRNEYGQLVGDCNEDCPCPGGCHCRRPCKRPHGHQGEHNPVALA